MPVDEVLFETVVVVVVVVVVVDDQVTPSRRLSNLVHLGE
jgi:hypothetical protein